MKIVIDGQEVELGSGGNEEGGLSQEEADERYLQLSGGRVTGPVEVPAPAAEGQAATKGYVDGALDGKLDKTATAAAATKLATARTIRTNLASTSAVSFDGSANVTPGVTGVLPVANGGTGNSSGYIQTGQKSGATLGDRATAEGIDTIASGRYSHAEGGDTIASESYSHVEGCRATASGGSSHAEGVDTTASGHQSHAEGGATTASGNSSHAEGGATTAFGDYSHAQNAFTIAEYYASTSMGRYNVKYSPAAQNFLGYYLVIGKGTSETARANCFRVTEGGVYATGNYNASGADYAEMFEWADGNPAAVDRVGRFVTLEGAKIRLAGPEDDYILGIVSGSPSVVGDVYDDQWQGMYLTDIFGRPIWEDVEVPDVTEEMEIPVQVVLDDGSAAIEMRRETVVTIPAHTERRQKLNPDYDNTQLPYIPRSERPEWDAVGMMGKLVAVDDGTCQVNGWAAIGEGGVATASAERTAYRVMERLDERHVRILIL